MSKKEDDARYYQKHKQQHMEYRNRWYKNNLNYYLWMCAKARAKRDNRDFTIDVSDVIVPDLCPVLGIQLVSHIGEGKAQADSPTIDRIDNTLGYIKGNVWVISNLANQMKKQKPLHLFLKELDEE